MRRWYAIYVRSRQEHKVFERLEKNGVQSFLPKVEVVRFYSDRKKRVVEVLFKSYVFVYIELTESMNVLQTIGVVSFVKFEGKPVPIPEFQIAAVKRYIQDERAELVQEDDFLLGQEIEIVKGPFKGQKGRLITISQKEMVVLELEVLNSFIPLKIGKSFLKKL